MMMDDEDDGDLTLDYNAPAVQTLSVQLRDGLTANLRRVSGDVARMWLSRSGVAHVDAGGGLRLVCLAPECFDVPTHCGEWLIAHSGRYALHQPGTFEPLLVIEPQRRQRVFVPSPSV